MNIRTVVVATILALAAGVGLALVLVRPSALVAAPPNAEMAPASLVAYVEIDGLAAQAAAIESSPSWRDFQASSLLTRWRGTATGAAWTDLVAKIESQARYPVDRERAMHFLGRHVALGFEAPGATGDPAWLLLAKLDVDALVRETLRGEGGIANLRAELERRTGAMDFEVRSAEHGGETITTASRGDVQFHMAILADTLVVSDSLALVRGTIDVVANDSESSLGRQPRWRDEVARLGPDALGVAWFDLEALRTAKPNVVRWLGERDATGRAARGVAAVLDGTTGAPALACAAKVPEGDLYRLDWNWSRTAAELAGSRGPDSPAALADCGSFLIETKDLGKVVNAWSGSALRRRFEQGDMGRKIREVLDDPTKLVEALQESPFPGVPLVAMDGEEEDDAEDAATASDLLRDKFVLKMGVHGAWQMLRHMLTGDLAVGGDIRIQEPGEHFVGAWRLGTDGLLLWLAGDGGIAARARNVTTWTHAGRTGRSDGEKSWALLGDLLVMSPDETLVREALDRAAAPPAAAAPSVLRPGWCLRAKWSDDFWDGVFAGALPDEETTRRVTDSFPAGGEAGLYVDDAFRTVEVRAEMRLRQDPATVPVAEEPRVWSSMPEPVVLAGGASVDFARLAEMMLGQADPDLRESFDDALRSADEAVGVGIRKELLPALGPEAALVATYAPAQGGGGGGLEPPPVIPGVLVAVDVRDETVVRRALDGVVRLIEEDAAESGPRESRTTHVIREEKGDVTFVKVVMEELTQRPPRIVPTLALGGGRLLVGLDDSVVQAALDAGAGRATSFARGPLRQRLQGVGISAESWGVVDWNRLGDQLAVYAPHIAATCLPDELSDGRKRPEFPEDYEDEAAVTKFQRETEAFDLDARRTRVAQIQEWIDAMRWIDFIAWTSRHEGRKQTTSVIVRFAE